MSDPISTLAEKHRERSIWAACNLPLDLVRVAVSRQLVKTKPTVLDNMVRRGKLMPARSLDKLPAHR